MRRNSANGAALAGSFDVFFSYHTVDHAAVTQVARTLHKRGIGTGVEWRRDLEAE